MTGTSLDGLDAALTRITGTGLDMTAEFIGRVSVNLPDGLRSTLRSLAHGEAHRPIEIMRAARHLGVVHAEACAQLMSDHGRGIDVDFVVAHGQTIWHAPSDTLSWQLFDPWPIVRLLKLPVCYDLRQADLIAGGEGAPITPIADPILYPKGQRNLVANLGGVCNITTWHGEDDLIPINAWDLSPCNLLLDGLAQRLFDAPFDLNGSKAKAGTQRQGLMHRIERAVEMAIKGKRSLGREQLSDDWFDQLLTHETAHRPEDWLASGCAWIAGRLIDQAAISADRVILAGGGTRNDRLVQEIQDGGSNRMPVHFSDDLGIPAEAREAMGFAVLGALSADGVPISLPAVTGSTDPGVAGVWATPDGRWRG
jgi:1,6-anhydro-N-acetylmuramate kinase